MVSPDVVAPKPDFFCVSTSVNLPLHHKVQKFSSGTGSPGWSRKKGRKTVVVVVVVVVWATGLLYGVMVCLLAALQVQFGCHFQVCVAGLCISSIESRGRVLCTVLPAQRTV